MNTQILNDWIIDNLKGKGYNLDTAQTTDIKATWAPGSIRARDGKTYDICILYIMNGKKHAAFLTSGDKLEDSINFSTHHKPNWNQNKLDQLVNEIVNNLGRGGDYKLKLIGNTGFEIVFL